MVGTMSSGFHYGEVHNHVVEFSEVLNQVPVGHAPRRQALVGALPHQQNALEAQSLSEASMEITFPAGSPLMAPASVQVHHHKVQPSHPWGTILLSNKGLNQG